MFQIKICGITRIQDAETCVQHGADAIGLNFYPPSPRSVSIDSAKEITAALADQLLIVGVFVNETSRHIAEIAETTKLGAIQLHGDEPAEFVQQLPADLPVIRAMRMDDQGLEPAAVYANRCQELGRPLAALLVDAASLAGQTEAYGGTGRTVDWARVRQEQEKIDNTPLILAGGLGPENVTEAILEAKPSGVDTASGVEVSPGIKDPMQVALFIERAAEALKNQSLAKN